MKNKTLITLGLIALTIVGVLVFSQIMFGSTEKVEAAVVIENASYDFGEIDIFDGNVKTVFVLKNTGESDVEILSAITSCMCTTGQIGDLVFGLHGSNKKTAIIPAGGETELLAVFDPLAHGPNGTGPITRELTLKTNSSETPELRAKFSAVVIKNE